MIAGIVMNVILGIILYIFILNNYAKHYTTVEGVNKEGGIYATTSGQQCGFQTGDKLISINGNSYERLDDYMNARLYFGSKVVVERNGNQVPITVADSAFLDKMRGNILFDLKATVKIDSLSDTLLNAKQAGILRGDIIRSVDSVDITCYSHLIDILQSKKINRYLLPWKETGN